MKSRKRRKRRGKRTTGVLKRRGIQESVTFLETVVNFCKGDLIWQAQIAAANNDNDENDNEVEVKVNEEEKKSVQRTETQKVTCVIRRTD